MDLVWLSWILGFLSDDSGKVADCLHLVYFFVVADPFVLRVKLAKVVNVLEKLLRFL